MQNESKIIELEQRMAELERQVAYLIKRDTEACESELAIAESGAI